jgi:YHS domain-containing protein
MIRDEEVKRKMDPTNYTFLFSSEENLALFREDPWKYAPRFGGF